MKHLPIMEKAILKAIELHQGQTRKDDHGTPYIIHPICVGIILAKHTGDDETIVAGILHDTIEDTSYTREQLIEDFGESVAEIVMDVTEPPKPLPWKQRKEGYLAHIKGASTRAQLVCAADKIHNLTSMIKAFDDVGEKSFRHFHAGNSLWFYEEVIQILKTNPELTAITTELEQLYKKANRKFFPKST